MENREQGQNQIFFKDVQIQQLSTCSPNRRTAATSGSLQAAMKLKWETNGTSMIMTLLIELSNARAHLKATLSAAWIHEEYK
jgi:hypothetical protein